MQLIQDDPLKQPFLFPFLFYDILCSLCPLSFQFQYCYIPFVVTNTFTVWSFVVDFMPFCHSQNTTWKYCPFYTCILQIYSDSFVSLKCIIVIYRMVCMNIHFKYLSTPVGGIRTFLHVMRLAASIDEHPSHVSVLL